MEVKRKFRTEKLKFPVDGYKYNVQVLTSVDGGKNYYYCGIGKFCKTKEECKQYISEYRRKHK